MDFRTTTKTFCFKDEDGNVLLEAPLMAFNHFLTCSIYEIQQARGDIGYIELAKLQADLANKEFGCSLTWDQLIELSDQVRETISELKKNNSSTAAE